MNETLIATGAGRGMHQDSTLKSVQGLDATGQYVYPDRTG